jgi:threonine dehydratase
MITVDDVRRAQARIAPYIRRTQTVSSATLSERLGTNVYLKLELFQKTGSFKPRGAFNKMLKHLEAAKAHGVVAVSGGNFAQGVAYAGHVLGVRTRILMPDYTPKNYLDATKSYGAEIELFPDIKSAFEAAEAYKGQGWQSFHPFDDPEVMEGYGTIGLELVEDIRRLTDVIVSVGGGGLMSGTTVAIKGLRPEVRVWSVETEGADALGQALQAGQVVHIQPTSLAKTLGAPYVAADALTVVQQHIAQHIVVSDREAYEAERFLLERAKVLTELAASCTLAAADRIRDKLTADGHLALILCGGNVSLDSLAEYSRLFG